MKRITTFRVNRSFINQLWKALSWESHGKQTSFPTQKHLHRIIETMIWASVTYEEGRLTHLRLSYSNPALLGNNLALSFSLPKELSVEELRRLAPAVPPPNGYIGVWPLDRGNKLRVWGLQTYNVGGVVFETIDPGRIRIKSENSPIAIVDGNDASFISPKWAAISGGILDRQSGSKKNREGDNKVPRRVTFGRLFFWREMKRDILRRIRLLKHGGTLLIVDPQNGWRASVDPLFYECAVCFDRVRPIAKALDSQIENSDIKADIFEPSSAMSSALKFYMVNTFEISECARAIAYLSAIDGATIVDDDLRVLAFGAKLRTVKREALSIQVINPGVEAVSCSSLEQEFRGTRHQSAALFIRDNPGARAFVISQDGSVTGLEWSDRTESHTKLLTAYRGLELLL
jgi:hypothetical protein